MYSLAIFSSVLLLIISVPIFLVFGIGSSAAAIFGLGLPWSTLIQVSFGAMTKHILVAVPLFIFAGMVMLKGGAAKRLVDFATALVGALAGGSWHSYGHCYGLLCSFLRFNSGCDYGGWYNYDAEDAGPRLSEALCDCPSSVGGSP